MVVSVCKIILVIVGSERLHFVTVVPTFNYFIIRKTWTISIYGLAYFDL